MLISIYQSKPNEVLVIVDFVVETIMDDTDGSGVCPDSDGDIVGNAVESLVQ